MEIVHRILAAAVLAPLLAAQTPTRTSPTPEQQQVFELLAHFDDIDTRNLPFVEFCTGMWSGTPPLNHYGHGFLLSSDGRNFRVRTMELQVVDLQASLPGEPECYRCAFAPADLRDYADELVRQLGTWKQDRDEWRSVHGCESPSLPTVALLVAHACARAGLQPQVDALWGALPRGWRSREELCAELSKGTLDEDLEQVLVCDVGDPRFSWQDLLRRHRKWLELFPASWPAEKVRARETALAKIVDDQGKAEAKGLEGEIHGLSSCFRPALVGTFERWPLWPHASPPVGSEQPFRDLVARGLGAVPALIASDADDSLTRSFKVVEGRYYVRARCDLAVDALQEISGMPFHTAPAWEKWFAGVHTHGIDGAVLEFLKSDDGLRRYAARHWLKHHPDDPTPVLAAATSQAPDRGYLLGELVRSAAVGDARVRAALRTAAREAEGRHEAQRHLMLLGDGWLVDDALVSWRAGRMPDADELVLLLQTGRLDLLNELHGRLEHDAVRALTAEALWQVDPSALFTRVLPSQRTEFASQLRAVLKRLLDDATPMPDGARLLYQRQVVRVPDATRADVGAAVLTRLWRDEFPFDPSQPAPVRIRQIAALRNAR